MITMNDITSIVREKNPQALSNIEKAYKMAEEAHSGVMRESGEPYITHPLHVAKNLLDMEVYDEDTICAALLHDVIEDTEITQEDIKKEINTTVAELVDGVTKMRRMNFSTKEEQSDANTRKIMNGLNKDLRIILIKLADRLHNMRTLEYKESKKQKENAIETMELFVPLALSIGAYQIKSELEDLSLMYMEPDSFKRIKEERDSLAVKEKAYLSEIKEKLTYILKRKDIPHDILIRTKNICNIYKKVIRGYEVKNIYDLFYLKILVDEVEDCYRTLSQVHRVTAPINGRFKDYIYSPRTNDYQSLHTTVSDKNGKIMKVKIRTFDMDKVSAFGIPAYWNIPKDKKEGEIPIGRTQEETQQTIRSTLQFAKKLQELDGSFDENKDFIREIKQELLTDHVYVYTNSGEIIELPYGSTALDFVCEAFPDSLDKLTGVIINDKKRPLNYVLENNDQIQIETKGIIDRKDWEKSVFTYRGKQKIRLLTSGQKLHPEL